MKKSIRLAVSTAAVGAFAAMSFAGGPVSAAHHNAKHPKGTVAFLGPEQFTGRWVKDAKYFKQKLHSLDPKATILNYNANANINTQTQQVNAAISKGAKVLVLAAVDQNEDAPLVNKAEKAGIKVLAYDRIIQTNKLRAYDSFNNIDVGKEQGGWLAKHVKKGGTIVEIRGSSTDHNATLFEKGFDSVMQPKYKSGYFKLGYHVWTPNWDPPTAGNEMRSALTKLNNKVQGVYSMNDAMAADILPAMTAQHLKHIPMTGQDAQPDGLGRILEHNQGMTVYKPIYDEAYSAAEVAYNWLQHKGLPKGYTKKCGDACKLSSGKEVPSQLFHPIKITLSNVGKPVKDGYDTWGGATGVCQSIGLHTSKPYCGLKH